MFLEGRPKERRFDNLPLGDWDQRCIKKTTQRPRFMSAADYVFYLRRHLAAERRRNNPKAGHPGDENISVGIPRLPFLLRRLEEDIQCSYTSFLDEFVSDLHDGVTCLLELLRTCHTRQSMGAFIHSTCGRSRQNLLNRALIDEFYCLLCLKATSRNLKAVEKIADHKSGLSTLAACIMSNHSKSRVLSLELLSVACEVPAQGYFRVMEAMSSVRLIFGESVRFKFLVSMLNSEGTAAPGFETVTLVFLNTLAKNCPRLADRVRIQCELEEAGFDVDYLEKKLRPKFPSNSERIWEEIETWRNSYIEVDEAVQGSKENIKLTKELQVLKSVLKKVQQDKKQLMDMQKELREKCNSLERKIKTLSYATMKGRHVRHSSSEDVTSGDTNVTDSGRSSYNPGCGEGKSREINESEIEEVLIDIPTVRAPVEPYNDEETRHLVSPYYTIKPRYLDRSPEKSTYVGDRPRQLVSPYYTQQSGLPLKDVAYSKEGLRQTAASFYSFGTLKADCLSTEKVAPSYGDEKRQTDETFPQQKAGEGEPGVEWKYPDIPGVKVEKRVSSLRVRFLEASGQRGVAPPIVTVKAPGESKVTCTDIVGVQKSTATRGRPRPSSLSHLPVPDRNKQEEKTKRKAAQTISVGTGYRSNRWPRHLTTGSGTKGPAQTGFSEPLAKRTFQSSISSMIHREITRAVRDFNTIY